MHITLQNSLTALASRFQSLLRRVTASFSNLGCWRIDCGAWCVLELCPQAIKDCTAWHPPLKDQVCQAHHPSQCRHRSISRLHRGPEGVRTLQTAEAGRIYLTMERAAAQMDNKACVFSETFVCCRVIVRPKAVNVILGYIGRHLFHRFCSSDCDILPLMGGPDECMFHFPRNLNCHRFNKRGNTISILRGSSISLTRMMSGFHNL